MMKERQIRTIIPFLIVFGSTFFLADAELLENFGTRKDMVKNDRLLWLLITGDGMQGIASFFISLVFFRAWYLNRSENFWFNDLMWQLSGAFFCWFLASMISILGTFWLFLWVQGMFRLFAGVFMIYVCNTVLAARQRLYHPETPEEAKVKAAKFDELIKMMKE
jgi:hypothetical protein